MSVNINLKKLETIATNYKLDLIILFGSEANGLTSRSSDIDIAIRTAKKEIDVTYESLLLSSLIEFFGRDKIDVVILNYADPLLQYEIATKGRLIYEKVQGSFNKFQVQAMKENNDAQKFYQLDRMYIKNFLKGARSDVIKRHHPPQIGKVS